MVQDMNIDPPDPVSISSLNDFLYCNRRCALHRLDALWVDNAWTVSGTLAHEHADDPGYRVWIMCDCYRGKLTRRGCSAGQW